MKQEAPPAPRLPDSRQAHFRCRPRSRRRRTFSASTLRIRYRCPSTSSSWSGRSAAPVIHKPRQHHALRFAGVSPHATAVAVGRARKDQGRRPPAHFGTRQLDPQIQGAVEPRRGDFQLAPHGNFSLAKQQPRFDRFKMGNCCCYCLVVEGLRRGVSGGGRSRSSSSGISSVQFRKESQCF